ncbi:MAG: ABC transporter ATP-binding protein [Deltaproteobacteria bacterium]|nr:ABC transporter ATP-binding protein [Deltaproteobacteria bacterium]
MLKISNLQLSIGDTKILDDISLTVRPGEHVGIIGPNGSGKTTLFNCISGFLTPQSGKIIFCNKDLLKLAPHNRALHGVGRVFQNFGIFREMTVLENVVAAIETKKMSGIFPWSKSYQRHVSQAQEFLAEVGLGDKADKKAGTLSGGQMRLLEISRALAFGAEMFMLDEPTAGVSPKMKGEVESLLTKLSRLNKTVLIIEHDMNFIQRLCGRIIVMDTGKIILDDTPENVRINPQLQEIYFGTINNDAHNGNQKGQA